MLAFPFVVPSGVARAEVRLGWREDWGRYPSADVDLFLIAPGGAVNVDGATASNPEVAGIDKPAAGSWTAVVAGFDIPTGTDKFELRVSLDGNVREDSVDDPAAKMRAAGAARRFHRTEGAS